MSNKDYTEKVNDEVEQEVVITEEPDTAPHPPTSGTVIDCGLLNVRAGDSTDSIVLGELRNGSKVKIKDLPNDEWVKINYKGNDAYVMRKYIKF